MEKENIIKTLKKEKIPNGHLRRDDTPGKGNRP